MCYLLAKRFDGGGSIAMQATLGKELSQFKKSLDNLLDPEKGIQLVVISDPQGYGEYAPYDFVADKSSFKEKVLSI